MTTMFVEQGEMMDTSIGCFTNPEVSPFTFNVISVIFWMPIYNGVIVPIVRWKEAFPSCSGWALASLYQFSA